MRKVVVLVGLWLLTANRSWAIDGGLGVCHTEGVNVLYQNEEKPGFGRDTVNWFYWGGGSFNWSAIEKEPGVYDFSAADKQVGEHFVKYPNSEMWVDMNTAMVVTVPDWAKTAEYGYRPFPIGTRRSLFDPWNEKYQERLDRVLGELKKWMITPGTVGNRYLDKITAINIMGGGPNGEMITGGFPVSLRQEMNYSGDASCETSYKPSCDDKYYAAVMKIVDIYVKHFGGFKPVVLQLGSGGYGKPDFMSRVANDVVNKYGNRVWLKYNGWSEAINAQLVTYPWGTSGGWQTVIGDKMGFIMTNNKARNILNARVRVKTSEPGSRNLKMVIYTDSSGRVGGKWAESALVGVNLNQDSQTINFAFPTSSLYLSYKYWITVEGMKPGSDQIEVNTTPVTLVDGDGGGWTYREGKGINWEETQIFKEGLSTHKLLASLAGKTRVGFEPGNFGFGTQAYPVQNPPEVIYNAIMETVDPARKSQFYVPVSYLCLQNDYFAKSGITSSQFKVAANYIRANASKPVGLAPSLVPTEMINAAGDANSDGQVDMADLGIWKAEYINQNGLKADFNRDGRVDLADLGIWKSVYLTK